MLTIIDDFLDEGEADDFARKLTAAEWIDGRATAGSRASAVKWNSQLDENSPLARELGNEILRRVGNHPLFISAALPERIYPPRFNRYADGGHYGVHVDAAIMRVKQADLTIRTDLSATLFLSDPDDYDGGELLIEGPYGAQAVKLPAGSLVLYPSTSLHQVAPVTRGARMAAIFWVQSLVADEGARALLFDLDQSIQALSVGRPADDPEITRLTSVYQNLLRRWTTV